MRFGLGPGFEDGGHESPGGFDAVAVGEERGVAEHGVEQEALVAVGGGLAEGFGVAEVHVDGRDVHGGAGDLGAEAEGDALVGLDAHGDDVGLDAFVAAAVRILKRSSGGCLNWMVISVTRLARRLPARM